jgi:hypothetical protein
MVLVHEWRSTSYHLVNKNAQSPPIDCKAMACHLENLRSEVFCGSTKALCLVVVLKELGKAEISNFDVTIHVHQDILWLEIAMDYLVGMKVSQPYEYLCSNKPDCFFLQPSLVAKVVENVAARNILEEKVDSQLILENVVHVNDEGVLGLSKDVFLRASVENLAFLDENVLVDPLHGILLAILRVDNQEHLSKAAFIDKLFDFEIFKTHIFIALKHLGVTFGHSVFFFIKFVLWQV